MAKQADAAGETFDIQSVGVIGAGQMGNGIAHVCALAGLDVTLSDVSKDQLDKALAMTPGTALERYAQDDAKAMLSQLGGGSG